MGKTGCSASSSTPRIERKIIEKNRRNRMKSFYSNLISLLPNHTSKEGLTVPDQIDEAVEYIKNLKMRVEECRQKKESLLPRKRSHSHCTTKYKMSPLVEIHDMGPNMDVILANGLQDYSTFYPMISWLHLHGFEIATANFCRDGNSTIQVGKSKLGFGGATMSGMQKDLVCGTSHSEVVESHLNLWDYEIETNIWGSQFPNGSM